MEQPENLNPTTNDPPAEPPQQQQIEHVVVEQPVCEEIVVPAPSESVVAAETEEPIEAQQQLPTAENPDNNTSETPAPQYMETWNVFVGDLTPNATEEHLKDAFAACGPIHSCFIRRDKFTNISKGYGFVHFLTEEAQQAAAKPPFVRCYVDGVPCKVKISEQKKTVFVGNLPNEMNEDEVRESILETCASVTNDIKVELKRGPPPEFRSRGFCFASFPTFEHADAAKKLLARASMRGRHLNVSWAEALPSQEVDEKMMATVTTLYVTRIPTTVSDETLRATFAPFGTLVKCSIAKNARTGEPRGFAFVQYQERADCLKALEALNGSEIAGQRINVELAKPPVEKDKHKMRGDGLSGPHHHGGPGGRRDDDYPSYRAHRGDDRDHDRYNRGYGDRGDRGDRGYRGRDDGHGYGGGRGGYGGGGGYDRDRYRDSRDSRDAPYDRNYSERPSAYRDNRDRGYDRDRDYDRGGRGGVRDRDRDYYRDEPPRDYRNYGGSSGGTVGGAVGGVPPTSHPTMGGMDSQLGLVGLLQNPGMNMNMNAVALAALQNALMQPQVPSVDPTTQLLLSQIGQLNPQQVQQLLTMVAAQNSGGALQQVNPYATDNSSQGYGVNQVGYGNYGYQGGR